jgi:hypothetical protein
VETIMKFDTKAISQKALSAALAGVLGLGLAACDQQQKPPPTRFGQNFEILPPGNESAKAASGPQAPVLVEIPEPADADLASRVVTRLRAEPALRLVTITVSAKDGVVTLNGTADSHANRDRAVLLALAVDGVYSVKNEMIVAQAS